MEIPDMPIPASTLENMREFQEIYKRFEEAKKLREKYPALKRRLEALRESRPVQETKWKDLRAKEHFELIKRQNETQIEKLQYYITQANQHLESTLDSIKKKHQIVVDQYQKGIQNVNEKMAYVDDKLKKANDRLESTSYLKTKEEILLEKQLVELIQEHLQLEPREDLAQSFPGHKELHLQLPTATLIKDQIIEEPKPTPSGPKVKRQPKQVLVEDPPTPPPSPPPTPPSEPVPEPQKALYGNVVQNTKLKRPPKQVSG